MPERFCKVCKEWHDLEVPWPDACHKPFRDLRSAVAAPMLIMDTMPPTQSMTDGKIYTSKAGIRASYKANGNPQGKEYVEVGNDPARLRPFKRPKSDKAQVVNSIKKAEARFDRGERAKGRAWTKQQGTAH